MPNRLVLAVAASALCVGGALAQTPDNPEDCLKTAFDIAQEADDKRLSNDELDKVEDLLTAMESHCDAKQFAEAVEVGREIKTMIDAKP